MLVDENRNGPAGLAEDIDRCIEEPLPRVEVLQLLVLRVIPMFPDDQNAVDGELAGPQGQRVLDGWGQPERVPLGESLADVVLGELVDVHAYELKVRVAALKVEVLPLDQPAQD